MNVHEKCMTLCGACEVIENGHDFVSKALIVPSECIVCHEIIMGLLGDAIKCRKCEIVLHKKCKTRLPPNCSGDEKLKQLHSAPTPPRRNMPLGNISDTISRAIENVEPKEMKGVEVSPPIVERSFNPVDLAPIRGFNTDESFKGNIGSFKPDELKTRKLGSFKPDESETDNIGSFKPDESETDNIGSFKPDESNTSTLAALGKVPYSVSAMSSDANIKNSTEESDKKDAGVDAAFFEDLARLRNDSKGTESDFEMVEINDLERSALPSGIKSSFGTLKVRIADTKMWKSEQTVNSELDVDFVIFSFGETSLRSTVREHEIATARAKFGKIISNQRTRHVNWDYDFVYEFPAIDVSFCELSVSFVKHNALGKPKPMGKVIIPFHRIFENRASGWFEIFPIGDIGSQFVPASPRVDKTGMDFPKNSLGYIRLECEFLTSVDYIGLLMLYLEKPIDEASVQMRKKNKYRDTMDTVKEIRRNFNRITVAKTYIHENIAPMTLWAHVRSWKNTQLSMIVSFSGCFTILFASFWQLPMLCVGIWIITGYYRLRFVPLENIDTENQPFQLFERPEDSLFTRKAPEKRSFYVWNQEIVDPSRKLSILEKTSSVTDELKSILNVSLSVAVFIEKCILIMNGTDTEISLVAAILASSAAFTASVLLLFLSYFPYPRLLYCLVFICSLFPRREINLEPPQFLKVIPRFVQSVWNRSPTMDDIGHRFICELQRVQFNEDQLPIKQFPSAGSKMKTGIEAIRSKIGRKSLF